LIVSTIWNIITKKNIIVKFLGYINANIFV
jgi:hypothetical protein